MLPAISFHKSLSYGHTSPSVPLSFNKSLCYGHASVAAPLGNKSEVPRPLLPLTVPWSLNYKQAAKHLGEVPGYATAYMPAVTYKSAMRNTRVLAWASLYRTAIYYDCVPMLSWIDPALVAEESFKKAKAHKALAEQTIRLIDLIVSKESPKDVSTLRVDYFKAAIKFERRSQQDVWQTRLFVELSSESPGRKTGVPGLWRRHEKTIFGESALVPIVWTSQSSPSIYWADESLEEFGSNFKHRGRIRFTQDFRYRLEKINDALVPDLLIRSISVQSIQRFFHLLRFEKTVTRAPQVVILNGSRSKSNGDSVPFQWRDIEM